MLDQWLNHPSFLVSLAAVAFMGSWHCTAMCGPLLLTLNRSKREALVYQMGRIAGYSAAGALVGSLGSWGFSLTRDPLLRSGVLILLAVIGILNFLRPLKQISTHRISFLWRFIQTRKTSPATRNLAYGLVSVFLPCGYLYLALFGAAATGSTIWGALYMLTFAAATLPALLIPQFTILKRLKPFQHQHPRLAQWLMIAVFSLSLFHFYELNKKMSASESNPNSHSYQLICH